MSEPKKADGEDKPHPPGGPESGGVNGTVTRAELDSVWARMKGAQEDATKARAELDALKATQKAKSDAELSEIERLKKDREALESKAKRADELEKRVQAMLDLEVASLPEKQRGLMPQGLAPDALLEWIKLARAGGILGEGKKAPPTDEGKSSPPEVKKFTRDQIAKMSTAEFSKHEDEINAAITAGAVTD